MDVDHHAPSSGGSATSSLDVTSSKVTVLRGHQSEVFTCAWNPEGDTIVSGYGPLSLSISHAHLVYFLDS